MYRYTGGIPLERRAVRILGWGIDEQSKTPYWLCSNAWGSDWGDNGYFRILRGKNECGIEDGAVAGLPLF